jgi:hypothetical protein
MLQVMAASKILRLCRMQTMMEEVFSISKLTSSLDRKEECHFINLTEISVPKSGGIVPHVAEEPRAVDMGTMLSRPLCGHKPQCTRTLTHLLERQHANRIHQTAEAFETSIVSIIKA